MENKSRVILYENLRRKIANMDVYSFSEQEDVAKNLPPRNPDETDENTEEENSTGIRKNTLSVSIDKLMDENESYQEQAKDEEIKKKYREKAKKERHGLSKFHVMLMVMVPCLLVVVVLVILFMTGVL